MSGWQSECLLQGGQVDLWDSNCYIVYKQKKLWDRITHWINIRTMADYYIDRGVYNYCVH